MYLCWSGLEHRYGTTQPDPSSARTYPAVVPDDMEALAPTVPEEMKEECRDRISPKMLKVLDRFEKIRFRREDRL